jgi:hypothetical protein
MIIKALVRGAVAAGAVAATVHVVRKYDLVTKAGVLANTAVEKAATGAEAFIAKGIGITSELLSQFADDPTKDEHDGGEGQSFEDARNAARATGRVPQGDVWTDATRNGNAS